MESLDMTEDFIKVCCRVRPANDREKKTAMGTRKCLATDPVNHVVTVSTKPEQKSFTYDFVADELVDQTTMFKAIGIPISQACLEGYNGTIIAYGQTGSGKTHTMFGPGIADASDDPRLATSASRGLVPRVLDFLWQHISRERQRSDGHKQYQCVASFYEIYQERVFDLLDACGSVSTAGLSVREDSKLGVYVDGAVEEAVNSPDDAARILATGYRNRHVGATTMNRESSRSHAVFSLSIAMTETDEQEEDDAPGARMSDPGVKGGVKRTKTSRFSMIDLAGSERQKDTHASGDRLKEASNINKSLSALGNVINALAERQSASAARRHVHYRDSKLTFLLRDSLGGNSKTCLIAAVSPVEAALAETLSTLKFAQRAKSIRNSAAVNEETSGSSAALQKEITFLRARIAAMAEAAQTAQAVPPRPPSSAPHTPTSSGKHRLSLGGSSSKGGKGTTPRVAPLALDPALLEEALHRCHAADELRLTSDVRAQQLSKRLEQAEKVHLSLKMQLKMRDAEVQRYRKKAKDTSTSTMDGTQEDPTVSAAAAAAAEVEVVRTELNAEVLRYRQRCDELERCARKQAGTENKEWTPESERVFTEGLEAKLQAALATQAEALSRAEALAGARFEESFGLSVGEAQGVRDRLAETITRAENAEVMLADLRVALVKAQARADTAEDQEREARAEASRATRALETSRSDIDVLEERLRSELAAQTERFSVLEAGTVGREQELTLQLQEQEEAHTEKFNKLMKDNMVLLKRSRELEQLALERGDRIEALEERMTDVQSAADAQATALQTQVQDTLSALSASQARVASLELEMAEVTATCVSEREVNAELSEELSAAQLAATEMQEEHHATVAEVGALKVKVEDLASDAKAARDDSENHWQQCQALTTTNEQLSTSLAGAYAQADQYKARCAALEAEAEAAAAEGGAVETAMAEASRRVHALEEHIATLEKDLEEASALRDTVAHLEREVAVCTSETQELREQLAAARLATTEADAQVLEVQQAHDAAMEEMCALTRELEDERAALAEITLAKARSDDLLEGCTRDKEAAEARCTGNMATADRLRADLDARCAEHGAAQDALAEERRMHVEAAETASSKLSEVRAQLTEMEETVATLTRALNTAEAAKVAADQRLEAARDGMQADVAANVARVNTLTEELSLARAARDTAQDEHERMATRLDAMGSELSTAQDALRAKKNALKEAKTEAYTQELSLKNQLREARAAEERCCAREMATKAQLAQVRTQLSEALEASSKASKAQSKLASAEQGAKEQGRLYEKAKKEGEHQRQRAEACLTELERVKEELSASKEARDQRTSEEIARTEEVAALRRDRDSATRRARLVEAEASSLREESRLLQERVTTLEQSGAEAAAENARLCGHQNTKQKIQQHMQLKRDIQDLLARTKSQQEVISKVTQERNALKILLHGSGNGSTSTEKREALKASNTMTAGKREETRVDL